MINLKCEVLSNENLKFTLYGDSDLQELRELSEEEYFDSDQKMLDVFDHYLSNSEYQWSDCHAAGIISDCPVLAIMDETGEKVETAWAYLSYDVKSPQQDLLEDGFCIFTKV